MSEPTSKYKVIGTRPIRHDGVDKVTGRAIYGADVQLPGLVYAKLLRSPHAHAKIKSIDTDSARKMPGVVAIVTGTDMPDLAGKIADLGEGRVNLAHLSQNCLAHKKVLYKGHAVAAVAATGLHAAEEAVKQIRVEYEPLPVVMDLLQAMKPDSVLLHDDVFTDGIGEQSTKPSNISKRIYLEQGNIEGAFAQADIVIEREFRTASVHQGYIEPHVSTALWNADGRLTIWTSTQGAFSARQQVSELLQLPVSRITVVPCEIGGGFGGKIPVYLEPVAALLSRKCGRPVKMTMQRDEEFQGTGPTPGSFVRVKLGATKAGRLIAAEAWLAYDAGAFPGGMIGAGCMCIFSCYDIANVRVEGFDVLCNKPKTAAYRAPGATQAAFACESVVDELSERLGIDPIDFRLQNAAKEGTRRVDGEMYRRIGVTETLTAVKQSEHYRSTLTGKHCGRGIATGFWFNIGLKSSATANVNPDGTVTLIEGSTDIGGTRTSVAMQLAETLGITAEEVLPRVGDTDSVGYTDLTAGSRVTNATGKAAYQVGLDIKRQMAERAAILFECEASQVVVDGATYSYENHSISFQELASKLNQIGEPVVGRATIDAGGATNGFGVHVVDLEVDPETGKVTILRYTAAQDVGTAIHPSYVEGQMQGGVAQGIGWALNEEYVFNDRGEMLNASFLDYRMPTSLDVPMIETIIVEVPNPDHPYGVRGVGETPIVAPPVAVANAIYRATGLRMRELPISPPRLWKAMSEDNPTR